MAGGDRHVRERPSQRGREAPLVLGVSKREQQSDRYRLRSQRLHRRDDARHLDVAQRLLHPGRPHPLGQAQNVGPGDERRRVIAGQVVQRGAVLSPEPEQVLEAARGHEHHPRPAPLEERVGRDRRAVNQELHGARQRLDRPKHPHRRIFRGRRDLADGDRAIGRDGDEVGEGAADVDA